jgi:hypothetical protein
MHAPPSAAEADPDRIESEAMAVVRKKMEGNEDQRRAVARLARSLGRRASALLGTTGASKQLHRWPRGGRHQHEHEARLASIHQGKQQSLRSARRRRG